MRLFAFAFILSLLTLQPAHTTEAGWALLRNGGHVVFLRHADAPGSGEPGNFDIENCTTQRNLSDRGRQQARRIGPLFLARAAPVARVLSSNYCRCLETARIAFGASLVETDPALDLLSGEDAANDEKLERVREIAVGHSGADNMVLVANEDVIMGVLGVSAREGEALILSRGDLHVAGRIRFN